MFPRFWGALMSNFVALSSIRVSLAAEVNRPPAHPVADKRWSQ
jgi:hypothetical protein